MGSHLSGCRRLCEGGGTTEGLHPGVVVEGGAAHAWAGGPRTKVPTAVGPLVGLFAQVQRVTGTDANIREPTQNLFFCWVLQGLRNFIELRIFF